MDESVAETIEQIRHESESEPLRYYQTGETVCLEADSQRWTASRIAYYEADQLDWNQRQRLNGG